MKETLDLLKPQLEKDGFTVEVAQYSEIPAYAERASMITINTALPNNDEIHNTLARSLASYAYWLSTHTEPVTTIVLTEPELYAELQNKNGNPIKQYVMIVSFKNSDGYIHKLQEQYFYELAQKEDAPND